LIASVVWWLVC